MNVQTNLTDQYAEHRLHRAWGIYFLAGVFFALGLFLALLRAWQPDYAWRWLAVTLLIVVYQFAYLRRHLLENRLSAHAPLLPGFGLANTLTIIRSVLNACLAGFLLAPWPAGLLAWLPGLFYLVSAVLDFLDGFAARVTRQTTILGERLDMKWDGAGMLIGTFLAVRYGQAPLPYLLVGLARYLFLFGLWLRSRQGLPVYDLPPSAIRRALAGTQMGFLAVILLPLFTPPATQAAALLFMLPLMVGFLRDWLSVSGQLPANQPKPAPAASRIWRILREGMPLVVRALVLILLVHILTDQLRLSRPAVGLLVVAILALPALLLGVAGRLAALGVLLMSGFALQMAPLDGRFWLVLLLSAILFMTGTGRFSLWKPEEWLIYHRPGERQH